MSPGGPEHLLAGRGKAAEGADLDCPKVLLAVGHFPRTVVGLRVESSARCFGTLLRCAAALVCDGQGVPGVAGLEYFIGRGFAQNGPRVLGGPGDCAEIRINYEFFGPASVLKERVKVSTSKRIAETSQCCGEIDVTFSKSGVKAKWNPSFESILDLAEANGLSPAYSCRSGICHTCLCRLKEGEVEYVLEPLDPPEPGYVLICCSKPQTNLVVDV